MNLALSVLMILVCPYCAADSKCPSVAGRIVRNGFFLRTSDGQLLQKYRCKVCRRHFSDATFSACVNQNKRLKNPDVLRLLCSGVSLRRGARLLNISRTTITRKLIFLGRHAVTRMNRVEDVNYPPITEMQFDDLETFEHTCMKPLSVVIAVEYGTRKILGFEVASMPCNGALAKFARAKYGRRPDERKAARAKLFTKISGLIAKTAIIRSDMNPHYPTDVQKFFPHAIHKTHKGRRGLNTAQGELKKGGPDPLFSINHTLAMMRANINRIFRKTWCTTKKRERMEMHFALYALFHNIYLT